jgi:hypothetical protein
MRCALGTNQAGERRHGLASELLCGARLDAERIGADFGDFARALRAHRLPGVERPVHVVALAVGHVHLFLAGAQRAGERRLIAFVEMTGAESSGVLLAGGRRRRGLGARRRRVADTDAAELIALRRLADADTAELIALPR